MVSPANGSQSKSQGTRPTHNCAKRDTDTMEVDPPGVPFTCTNRRFKDSLVKERLHRFLCSEQWRNIFSNILVAHMAARGSDHLPIWIEFYKKKKNIRDSKNRWGRRFNFEDYWSSYDDCERLIEISWHDASALNGNNPISMFLYKVENLKEVLNA
ncbi:hypothetical protein WN943_010443 [Citrus x changshan-huyou]